jgi:uncharacterized membrane protein YcaP (DUF421 family)
MDVDFAALFRFGVSPLELIVRGTAIYWFIFLLFRVILRRDTGSLAMADVLLMVLIADAAQNAMAGGYQSVSEGFVLIATIAGWNLLLDWLTFRFDAMSKLLEPRPLLLVRNGRLQHHNLRRQFVSHDDLMAKLREHGVQHLSEIKAAYLESGGEISVLRRERSNDDEPPQRPSRPA